MTGARAFDGLINANDKGHGREHRPPGFRRVELSTTSHPDGRTVLIMRDLTVPLDFVRAGLLDYQAAWDRQRALASARADGTGPDTVLLLEHPAVYTAGKRTQPEDRPTDGTEVIDVDRGGMITWHGPGQLVGYPVLRLPDPVDVVAYVRRVEALLIDVCAEV